MNQQEIIVNFSSTGVVSGLHFDELDLGFLGDKKIGRASSIEFDEETQSFLVLPAGKVSTVEQATNFIGYDNAREFEVEWLQACMKARHCDPYSTQGVTLASVIRAGNDRYAVHGRKAGGA